MKDWKKYWNSGAHVESNNKLKQVGKTVNGIPIAPAQFAAIVDDVRQRLALNNEDIVLDLCCGNGAITREIAPYCRRVVGVDFSEPLIRTARTQFQALNIEYVLTDACALAAKLRRETFTKVYMYEALQHFSTEQLDVLLGEIKTLQVLQPIIYIASIPDARRIRNFYNSPERWLEYETRLADGTEMIGHWWIQDELTAILRGHDYVVGILQQAAIMSGRHYRFDALCIPSNQAPES